MVAITPNASRTIAANDGDDYFDLSAGERNVDIIGEIFPESSTAGVQVIGVPAFFMVGSDATAANQAAIIKALQGPAGVQY